MDSKQQQVNKLLEQLAEKIANCDDAALLEGYITAHTNLRAMVPSYQKLDPQAPITANAGIDPQAPTTANAGLASDKSASAHDVVRQRKTAQDDSPKSHHPAPLPKHIRQIPEINRESQAQKITTGLRTWYLMRGIDTKGQGWLTRDTLRDVLTGDGEWSCMSWARLRQVIREYDGKFWDDFGDSIAYYSAGRVAAKLGVDKLGDKLSWGRVSKLAGSLRQARGEMYAASFHATREPAPISQEAVETITHIKPRTQREYNKLAGIKTRQNIALSGHLWKDKIAREKLSWGAGKPIFKFTDWKGKFSKPKTEHIAYCRPNSYKCGLGEAPSGILRKYNRKISLVNGGNQQLSENDKNVVRMYYQDGVDKKGERVSGAVKAAKAFSKHPDRTHHWKDRRGLRPNVNRRYLFSGVDVWHTLSLEGAAT